MTTTMEATDVRKQFGEVSHRVAYGDERVVITKHGKALVALVPLSDLAELEKIEDQEDVRIARERLADVEAGRAETVSFEDALAELGLTK